MRRLVVFFSILFGLATLFSPRALAQTSPSGSSAISTGGSRVGTHLYQFDPGAELIALRKIKDRLGELPTPYPIVVMVGADDPNAFAGVLAEASDPRLLPIIRIIKISSTMNPSAMDAVASVLNSANLPPGTPVELGNELYRAGGGDRGPEWDGTTLGSFNTYAALYNELAGKLSGNFLLGMAAMNHIPDGGGLFSTESIMDTILPQISRVQATFANVYQQAGHDLTADSQWSMSYIKAHGNGGALSTENLFITEFGDLTCSLNDYDCLQTFYETQDPLITAKAKVGFAATPGLPANASFNDYQHTLPAICEYWRLNTFEVSRPKKCGAPTKPIYLFPGIDDQKTDIEKLALASTYTMTCASPYTFKGVVINGAKSAAGFTDTNYYHSGVTCPENGRCILPEVVGTAKIDDSTGLIPLFRMQGATVPNPSAKGRHFYDLEGIFGSTYSPIDKTLQTLFEAPLENGTTNKLTGTEFKCQQTVSFLNSIKQACAQPQPPSESLINNDAAQPSPTPSTTGTPDRCALDLSIPGTRETYLSVLSKIGNFACGPNEKLSDDTTKLFNQVELTLPKAFKPAYIVRYINSPQTDPPPGDTTIFDKLIRWLSPGTATSTPGAKLKDRIKITKVYVPAGVASTPNDKSSLTTTSYIKYTTPIMQTLQAITPRDIQKQIEDNKNKQMDTIFNLSSDPAQNLAPDSPDSQTGLFPQNGKVDCPECAPTDLESIFVRRINAAIAAGTLGGQQTNLDCSAEDLAGETAARSTQSINPPGNPDPTQKTEIPIRAGLHALAPDNGARVKMRTFFFLPEEYRNVTDYEDVLVNGFIPAFLGTNLKFSETKIADPAADQNYKFLQLSGSGFTIDSPQVQGSQIGAYVDKSVTPPAVSPVNLFGQVVGDSVKSDYNPEPQVPGGRLARGLWEIMCHAVQPFKSGQTYAPYQGFEKLLQGGTKACFTDNTFSPTLFSGLSDYFKALFDIGARYATMTSPPKTCGFAYTTKDKAHAYAAELPKFIAALKLGFNGRGIHGIDNEPIYGSCGGENCAQFLADTVMKVPVCDGNSYVNPYYVALIALHEMSDSTIKPNGTGYYFGCQPYAFSIFNPGASYQGLTCEKKMDPKTNLSAISPIIPSAGLGGVALTTDVAKACFPSTATPLGQANRENLTFEDAFACMMGRMQNFCELSVPAGQTADFYAEYRYSYKSNGAGAYNDTELIKTFADYAQLAKEGGFTTSFTGQCEQ